MIKSAQNHVAWLTTALLAIMMLPAAAKDEMPQMTPEGMELVKQTRSRVVYSMPGATLDQYTKVALLDCYVAFAKNWDRDYNRDVNLSRRVRPDDMEEIKAKLAEEFAKVFGVSKQEYTSMPDWKATKLKEKSGLF